MYEIILNKYTEKSKLQFSLDRKNNQRLGTTHLENHFLNLYLFRCNKIDHIVCFMCKLLFNKPCHAKLLACIGFTLA